MSRELPPELEAELLKSGMAPFIALFIDFPDPVRAFTGRGRMVLDGEEYLGIHGIASIDTIGETTSGSAVGAKATLLQVPSEFAPDIADQAVRGVAYQIFAGAFNLDHGHSDRRKQADRPATPGCETVHRRVSAAQISG